MIEEENPDLIFLDIQMPGKMVWITGSISVPSSFTTAY
jgi:CheY-like chemotaxis protein